MPWSNEAPPDVAKDWTPEEQALCVTAANAVLADGGTDEDAIVACIAAAGKGEKPAAEAPVAEGASAQAHKYIRAYRADEQPKAGPIRFIASTEERARDGLTIKADGWQLANYAKNPIVLWAHDYIGNRPPIGKATTKVEKGQLLADVTFDKGDPFAADIERKYREGFLNAVSVGWETLEGDDKSVTKAELLDISAVPVPGDPGALIERQYRALRTLALESVTQSGTPEPDGARLGAVLNARNKAALQDAVDLIRSVLKSAEKAPPEDDETERALREIQTTLGNVQVKIS